LKNENIEVFILFKEFVENNPSLEFELRKENVQHMPNLTYDSSSLKCFDDGVFRDRPFNSELIEVRLRSTVKPCSDSNNNQTIITIPSNPPPNNSSIVYINDKNIFISNTTNNNPLLQNSTQIALPFENEIGSPFSLPNFNDIDNDNTNNNNNNNNNNKNIKKKKKKVLIINFMFFIFI
ncbi:hypothetical protein BCR32DRAFT_306565, partial [Anaeromyces robustus]